MTPISEEARQLQEETMLWRRTLHQMPETQLVLPQTAAFLESRLREMGIDVQKFDGHSGMTAYIGHGGKTVAIRADMDGLPIKEESGVPFASRNGNMHACGHDAHTAMLLTAAKLLKTHERELCGTIKLIFEPGEERPGGALPMVEVGVMDDVDYILAAHVGELTGYFEPGQIAVSYTDTFASSDRVEIDISGKGGHASVPAQCVDPISIATLVMNNLQYIISREIDAHDSAVFTIGAISAGNMTACNVIPDSASLLANIRAALPETKDYLKKRIVEISEATAAMMKGRAEVRFHGFPALVNDKAVVESFLTSARKVLAEDEINILSHGIMAGEDAAFFFEKAPGCYFLLANSIPCPADGRRYGHHNAKFCIDDSVLWRGSALLALAAMDLLEKPPVPTKKYRD